MEKENIMQHVTSKDGTTIVYDRIGEGPALVIVGGLLDGRSQQAGLAQLLASHFTVYNFDRRGHGGSGDNPPYAVEGGVEEMAAIFVGPGGVVFWMSATCCGCRTME